MMITFLPSREASRLVRTAVVVAGVDNDLVSHLEKGLRAGSPEAIGRPGDEDACHQSSPAQEVLSGRGLCAARVLVRAADRHWAV
jgi:hypothetical protein